LSAVKRFISRVAFLVVPISILLIRYYPAVGRDYKHQDGRQVFVGVTNDKNMLGVICLLFGLGALWRVLHSFREKRRLRNNRPLIAQSVILVMMLFLFALANSMTSLASFVLAGGLMTVLCLPAIRRRRALVHVLVASVVTLASMALFFDAGSGLVKTLGRDPTLTGRTELWGEIISLNNNPLLGTGYESFWMGSRLEKIWDKHWWHPNEAHNGYLEVFLNLGWIGIVFLALVLINGYRHGVSLLRREPEMGRLVLAYFTVGLIYSFTEAGFRLLNPVWIAFLMAAIAVPMATTRKTSASRTSSSAPLATDKWPNSEIHEPSEAGTVGAVRNFRDRDLVRKAPTEI